VNPAILILNMNKKKRRLKNVFRGLPAVKTGKHSLRRGIKPPSNKGSAAGQKCEGLSPNCAQRSLQPFLEQKRGAVPAGGPKYLPGGQIPAFKAEDPTGPGKSGIPGNFKMNTPQAIRRAGTGDW
jgi:hypothetical protein